VGEAIEKTLFYITHDDIRARIAQAGYVKVKERFTYSDRLQKMFDTAGLMT
jgi:spore maturation protein CgeB